jgi:hypothetical protein
MSDCPKYNMVTYAGGDKSISKDYGIVMYRTSTENFLAFAYSDNGKAEQHVFNFQEHGNQATLFTQLHSLAVKSFRANHEGQPINQKPLFTGRELCRLGMLLVAVAAAIILVIAVLRMFGLTKVGV